MISHFHFNIHQSYASVFVVWIHECVERALGLIWPVVVRGPDGSPTNMYAMLHQVQHLLGKIHIDLESSPTTPGAPTAPDALIAIKFFHKHPKHKP